MRRLRHLWRITEFVFVRVVWMRAASVLGGLRAPMQVIEEFSPNGEVLGARVAVFAHFDRHGEVRPHVAAYLEALRAEKFSVVFVTNSGRLTAAARATLAPLCARVLVRRNCGYDFGAWRDGLARCNLLGPDAAAETLLLANDSVYGPLFPLDPVLARAGDADAVGLTESWQTRYHLQSYFLLLSGRVLRAPAWAAFWATVRPAPSKALVIFRYEVGLTQALLRAGFSVRALFGYADLLEAASGRPALPPADRIASTDADVRGPDPAARAREKQRLRILQGAAGRTPLNPTSDLWRELLAAGFPFIKRELLRDNPTDVHDVADLLPSLQATGVDIALMERDLRRVLRRTSP